MYRLLCECSFQCIEVIDALSIKPCFPFLLLIVLNRPLSSLSYIVTGVPSYAEARGFHVP